MKRDPLQCHLDNNAFVRINFKHLKSTWSFIRSYLHVCTPCLFASEYQLLPFWPAARLCSNPTRMQPSRMSAPKKRQQELSLFPALASARYLSGLFSISRPKRVLFSFVLKIRFGFSFAIWHFRSQRHHSIYSVCMLLVTHSVCTLVCYSVLSTHGFSWISMQSSNINRESQNWSTAPESVDGEPWWLWERAWEELDAFKLNFHQKDITIICE